jgi:hypothetical protein
MSNSQIGWAPPERIKRSVHLPEELDAEIEAIARQKRSTPSALLADALGNAVEEGWTASQEPLPPGAPGPERVVALNPEVLEVLNQRIEELHSSGRHTDLSELTAMLALFYLRHRVRHEVGEGTSGEGPAD